MMYNVWISPWENPLNISTFEHRCQEIVVYIQWRWMVIYTVSFGTMKIVNLTCALHSKSSEIMWLICMRNRPKFKTLFSTNLSQTHSVIIEGKNHSHDWLRCEKYEKMHINMFIPHIKHHVTWNVTHQSWYMIYFKGTFCHWEISCASWKKVRRVWNNMRSSKSWLERFL